MQYFVVTVFQKKKKKSFLNKACSSNHFLEMKKVMTEIRSKPVIHLKAYHVPESVLILLILVQEKLSHPLFYQVHANTALCYLLCTALLQLTDKHESSFVDISQLCQCKRNSKQWKHAVWIAIVSKIAILISTWFHCTKAVSIFSKQKAKEKDAREYILGFYYYYYSIGTC